MKNDAKTSSSSQLAMLLVMVLFGGITLTDEQISAISQVILASDTPLKQEKPSVDSSLSAGDTVRGLTELAQILGVSVPTACKISRSGKFDAARLNFGTKKFVWDKAKLLEIARENKNN